MPKPLLDRCQPDSIREFRAAAEQRRQDAEVLTGADRRTAAIYLWGYAAEMTLKAAYFRAIGFAETQPITLPHLHAASQNAPNLGAPPFQNLHDIYAWAELLVRTRAATPGLMYPVPGYGNHIVLAARTIYALWREFLRYHKNIAYEHEVAQVQTAASWLLANSSNL